MARKNTAKANKIEEPEKHVFRVGVRSEEGIIAAYFITAEFYSAHEEALNFYNSQEFGEENVASFKEWVYCKKEPKNVEENPQPDQKKDDRKKKVNLPKDFGKIV